MLFFFWKLPTVSVVAIQKEQIMKNQTNEQPVRFVTKPTSLEPAPTSSESANAGGKLVDVSTYPSVDFKHISQG